MYEIKKVNILSVAKIGACLGLIISLIPVLVGLFTFLGGLFFSSSNQDFSFNLPFFLLFILPVIFAIAGFIKGLIFGFIYNLIAPHIGGVEMEIVLKKEKIE